MILNVTQPIEDYDKEITMGRVLEEVLRNRVQGETLDGPTLYHMGMVCDQIRRAVKNVENVDLPVEDLAMLKERAAKVLIDPLLVKRVWDALEAK